MVTTDRLKQLEKENQDKINKKIKEQEMTQKRLDSETKKMNKTISDTKTQIKIIAELETKLQNEEISRQQAIEELRKGDLEDIIKNFKLKSTPKINELVIGIDKNNFNTDEDDNLDGMACELIDKIVVHEAVEKKPNRQQQVDIYYNFIGQFDLPLSEKEIAEARRKAEQEAAEKAKRKKNRQRESNVAHRAKAKAERWAANDGHEYPKRICEQCGKEFYPNNTRQRFCNTDCTKAHQQAEKEKKRYAEKGNHTFRQKVCKICGKPFWPSNGQEVLCSEECKTINRNQRQLAYYHRKQSGHKAGEAI